MAVLFSVPILSVAMVMSPCLGDRSTQLDVSRVVGVRRAVALAGGPVEGMVGDRLPALLSERVVRASGVRLEPGDGARRA
jgi:hypothetical protein